ncbi:MAG TPA: SIMPL domain-containing protein [Pyrinomonadaceae bacterium]|nr:SIMPL domain-containing protein [Pyrinomonadaceae bacterium]
MKKTLCLSLLTLCCAVTALAQEAANRVYANQGLQQPGDVSRRRPAYPETSTEQIVAEQPNQLVTTYQFLDAKILTSVDTKEYISVFGLAQEADTVPAANKKLQDQITAFQRGLAALGIRPEDTFVDFITQNRVYDYVVKGSTAREKVSGFQIKENLAIRYHDRGLLDQIVSLAAQGGIFDLIKVDYITADLATVRGQMAAEAQKILKQKEDTYNRLGIKLTPVSVAAENFDTFQPFEAYNSYKAFESGNVDDNYRVVERRKNSTFYFEPLSPGKFDLVLSPIGLAPAVQCTFYLRVRYFVNNHTTVVTPEKSDKKPD